MKDQPLQNGERIYARLRMRTALGGAVIFLIPFLLFTVLVQLATERYVKRELLERLRAAAATNARLLDDVLALRVQEARSLARTVASRPSAHASSVLRQFVENHPWYDFAAIANPAGVILHSSATLPAQPDFGLPAAGLNAGEVRIAQVGNLSKKSKRELCILFGAGDGGKNALVLQLDSARLASRFLDFGIAGSENTFLASRAGEILARPRREDSATQDRVVGPDQPVPFFHDSGTVEFRAADGSEVLAAYQLLARGSAYIVVQVNRAEMQTPVKNLRAEVMLYVLPFLLLGVVLAVLAWRFALHYIQRLMTELYQALHVAQQRERERDLANQELARRFEQERLLAHQQAQFQAQLAEYEKYAALTQLALGAAHE
ncbi:MAG TPA: hypothetical protein VNL38_00480, partial [Candidatus Nitrosotenuis sp.]|nr:hypothetical protein [Candidatus Nitrosotenuis sp.]